MLVGIGALGMIGCSSDAATDGDGGEPKLEPGQLRVGLARVRIPAPVGIGTVGYAGFSASGDSSPFAELFPATDTVHGHPELRAAVISRGPGYEVIFLRADMVGIFQQLRRAVVLELEKRMSRTVDDALIFGGTHTHSGPGRIVAGGAVYNLIADRFFPEYYERLVDAAADVVEKAYDNLAPGRVGYVETRTDAGISDRRCEDGKDYVHGALPMVALERGGKIAGVVLTYPVHGTVLGIEDYHLSREVSGAIEQVVEDSFDHPVQALYFNSWAGDMSPSTPKSVPERSTAASQPFGYDKMEKIGYVVAKALRGVRSEIRWESAPEIAIRTYRTRIDREAIGYAKGVFPYEYGGIFCGGTGKVDCNAATREKNLDKRCVPFPKAYPAPDQTVLTAGRIGALRLVTFPGEPGTLLGEKVVAGIERATKAKSVLLVGYAQDHLGYSILEDDWWQGGYEASGSLWGPKQGEYLMQRAIRFGSLEGSAPEDAGAEPKPVEPFVVASYKRYVPTRAKEPGKVLAQVSSSYSSSGTVVFTVSGSDPWLGAPLARLETADGKVVKRRGGQPVDSDGYAFQVKLIETPSYDDAPKATSRTFAWRFSLVVQHKTDIGLPKLKGDYRLRVELPRAGDKRETVRSAVFSIQ